MTASSSFSDPIPVGESAPGLDAAVVVLRPHKLGAPLARHPWVFDTAIAEIAGDCPDGAVVDVVSDKRRFIARGILNRQSHLRVRLYTWQYHERLDDQFWANRIERAVRWRSALGYDDPDGAARLIYSEADGLSGLVLDRYGRHLVLQVNALAVAVRLPQLIPLLAERLQPASITVRCEAGIAKSEGISPPQGLAWGQLPDGPVFIAEHGLRYGVDLLTGQKTGCYLDQRENRKVAAAYLRGRRVLDLFCFSGGFSLAAARVGGARDVLGIDSSERAVTLARANAELNGITSVRFRAQDCFEALQQLRDAGECFGGIILDPPKFARTRQSLNDALRAYHRLNRLAADLLEPDGILVTCSCSGSVSREDFLKMLSGVAQKSGRLLQVLEQRGAAPDHPLSPTCPENEYLKCCICRMG